jgi:tripartite-type tricarboxylate transporter receptor subunit TctC
MLSSIIRGLVLPIIVAAGAAHAQGYPAKPVHLVAPSTPGGSVDIVARMVGQRLGDRLGRQFVIDNRPGAGNNIGADYVAKSPPDGYTLLLGSSPVLAANTHLYSKMPFDPIRDFAPVILIARQPNVLVVNPSLPAASVPEFIALARSRPQKLTFGSGGVGSSQHIAAELFTMSTGIGLVHVPYKGGGQALVDLLGGQIDLMFDTAPTALPHIKGGKLRALAVTTGNRFGLLPSVPTLAESGMPGFDFGGFLGLVAPAGTPADVVAKLNGEIQAALNADLRARLTDMGLDVAGGTPEQFAAFMREESAKYARIVKEARIQPQ